eukprot:EG_transcript_6243
MLQLKAEGHRVPVLVRALRRSVAICNHIKARISFPIAEISPSNLADASNGDPLRNLLYHSLDGAVEQGTSPAWFVGVRCAVDAARELLCRSLSCDANAVQVTGILGPPEDASFVRYGLAFPCSAVPEKLASRATPTAPAPNPLRHTLRHFRALRLLVVEGDVNLRGSLADDFVTLLAKGKVQLLVVGGTTTSAVRDCAVGSGLLIISDVQDADLDRLCCTFRCVPSWEGEVLEAGLPPEDCFGVADVEVLQFSPAEGRHRKAPWRYYAVLSPPVAADGGPPGRHAAVAVLLCSPLEVLLRRAKAAFHNTLAKARNMAQVGTVVPGAGFAETAWAAALRNFEEGQRRGEVCGEEFGAEEYDPQEGAVLTVLAECLEMCLVHCLVNASTTALDAIEAVTAAVAAFRAYLNEPVASAMPEFVVAKHPELAGVKVVSATKRLRLVPMPPLCRTAEVMIGHPIEARRVPHWEDMQGRYGALARAVALTITLLTTEVVTP